MKAAFRPISSVGMAALPASLTRAFGPEPELRWADVADLVIDTSYQRDITRKGVTNIRRIAENFSWAKFGAVICAPAEGEKLAVIDGQHRVTAAALLGIRKVPCQIIVIDRAAQAAAFNAINAVVTQVHTLHSFAAAVTAGEAEALALAAAAGEARVTICRYPRERAKMVLGETVCVVAMRRAMKRHGRDVLVLALKCLRAGKHDRVGGVNSISVRVMTNAIGNRLALRDDPARTLAAMAKLDVREFADLIDSCTSAADVAASAEEAGELLLAHFQGTRVRR